ncbi:hypothetical protein HELRODRAFT_193611 [Helobdella robusta]|uniref:MICOS complex subunit MIC60 n=1 Tax=Helobdella robusta TaxID=6412 RepID=T1FV65_HELRO|nr:hypothetical protein HELRODRAFT_193611 [Helobdella robusta]ESN95270.1 hypothetical protein HELRODRAFT_193611 [Helobdella robusta]
MWRVPTNLPKCLARTHVAVAVKRNIRTSKVLQSQDVNSAGGGGGGILKKLIALTFAGAGGVVGYSWYDPEFKKLVEENVPYAKECYDAVFQYLPESASTIEDAVKRLPIKTTEITTVPPPVQAPIQEDSKPEVKAEEKVKTKKEREKEKKEEAEKLLKLREENEINQNKALEALLMRTFTESASVMEAAMKSAHSAAEAVKEHTVKLKEALQKVDAKEGEWEAVTRAHDAKVKAMQHFEEVNEKAKQELAKLREVISTGKSNKVTKKNKLLWSTEDEANKLNRSFNTALNEVSKAEADSKVFKEYRDLIKKGKEQFKKELESIMPDVKKATTSVAKLTEDELNALIAHAHKRIDQLQRQLAEQQALEQLRINEALSRQREEDAAILLVSINKEKELWDNEINLIKAKWDIDARVNFEEELKLQLTRQAAAHSDHISEVLRAQQRELEAKFSLMLSEHVENERREFQRQVAGWVARLHGIEDAIDKRASLEKQGHQVQKLWLACESLQTVLNTGKLGATSWEGRLKPLAADVELIRSASTGQPAVEIILDSIPEVALNRGVWTEAALIERFKRVCKISKRVAMIDETTGVSGSLFKYGLSYLQSMFVVTGVGRIYDSSDLEIDPDEIKDTFVLLDNAQACLDRGDFAQAVRFVNHLSGEAKTAASDWLAEARLLLETKQAAVALLATASAAGFTSIAGCT